MKRYAVAHRTEIIGYFATPEECYEFIRRYMCECRNQTVTMSVLVEVVSAISTPRDPSIAWTQYANDPVAPVPP